MFFCFHIALYCPVIALLIYSIHAYILLFQEEYIESLYKEAMQRRSVDKSAGSRCLGLVLQRDMWVKILVDSHEVEVLVHSYFLVFRFPCTVITLLNDSIHSLSMFLRSPIA